MNKHKPQKNQSGFTIVELLIATSILSVILLLVTIMMLNVGKLYQKGIVASRVQDNARSIADELSQRIQLSNLTAVNSSLTTDPVTHDLISGVYCIGQYRYTFVINKQLGSDPTYKHVLWRDTVLGSACNPVDLKQLSPSNSGQELIATGSSLQNLSITPDNDAQAIAVTLAYGDPTQLVNSSSANAACSNAAGNQFCSTTTISTTTVPRIAGGN